MKKKQFYEKPSMKAVLLQQCAVLLAGSSNGVNQPDSFTPGEDPLNQSAPELDFLNPMDE